MEGDFTKQEAEISIEKLVEMHSALSPQKRSLYEPLMEDIRAYINASKTAAPDAPQTAGSELSQESASKTAFTENAV